MNHFIHHHWQSARSAYTKFLSHPSSSLLNLLMLSLSLALPLAFYLIISSAQEWTKTLSTPQITLFMAHTAHETELSAIKKALDQHQHIASFHFVSRTEALDNMKKYNGLSHLSTQLENNPLPDAFIVTPNTLKPDDLAALQHTLATLAHVETTQFDAHWAKKLYALLQLGQQLSWLISLTLCISLLLITYNTIRLQILARRDEIIVSKLIGAPNSFIRRPFIYHALYQALLSALIAWGLTQWLTAIVNPAIESFTQLYQHRLTLRALNGQELALLFSNMTVLAILAAHIATGLHLNLTQSRLH